MRGTPTRRQLLQALASVAGAAGLGTVAAQQPDEFIIGTSTPEARQAAEARAERVIKVLDFGPFGQAVVGIFPEQARDALRQRPGVDYIEENGIYRTFVQELPWGIDRVDAEVAHTNGQTGSEASIAIIDTGIDSDHPDLNVSGGVAFVSCRGGPNTCRAEWDDDHGHGTHCAGIADALDNTEGVVGVSTQAGLYAVKVLDNSGSGTWADVADGIRWTADNGINIGSMSLGGGHSNTVQRACNYAHSNGVLLIAAAGNDGGSVSYPAKYETVVAISATNRIDNLASWSNRGPEIELAAPGVNILSTVPGGYDTKSGTSMACPHVSGAAALAWDEGGGSNDSVRSHLKSTAEDIGLSSEQQGAGLVDAAAAVGLDSSDDLDGGGTLTVETHAATDVTDSSATLNGELTDLGGHDSVTVYFEYRQSGASSWTTTPGETRSSTGTFSETVTDLQSNTEYEFRAAADADGDGAAEATGDTLTFTTSTTGGDNPPAITQFDVSNQSNPAWARWDVTWTVTDQDGDLATVELTLTNASGQTVDSETVSVSGESASGTTRLEERNGSGDYTITLTVTDQAGNSTTEQRSVSTSGAAAQEEPTTTTTEEPTTTTTTETTTEEPTTTTTTEEATTTTETAGMRRGSGRLRGLAVFGGLGLVTRTWKKNDDD